LLSNADCSPRSTSKIVLIVIGKVPVGPDLPALPERNNFNNLKGDNSMETKDAYVAKLKAQIDGWSAEIDKLEAKAKKTREDYETQIKALRQKYDSAKVKITEIQQASEASWQDLKQGIESAWSAFKQGLDKAKARFK